MKPPAVWRGSGQPLRHARSGNRNTCVDPDGRELVAPIGHPAVGNPIIHTRFTQHRCMVANAFGGCPPSPKLHFGFGLISSSVSATGRRGCAAWDAKAGQACLKAASRCDLGGFQLCHGQILCLCYCVSFNKTRGQTTAVVVRLISLRNLVGALIIDSYLHGCGGDLLGFIT